MKIVIVIPSLTNYHTFLKEICLRLCNDGHSLHLITSNKHLNGSIDNNLSIYGTLHLINFPRNFNFINIVSSICNIISILRKIKPDLVHGHFFITLFLLSFCKLLSPYKYIATLHGVNSFNFYGLRKYIYLFIEIFSIRLLDHVFILNKCDEHYLKPYTNNISLHRKYGIGCDINIFNKNNIDKQIVNNVRAKLNLSGNEFIFVFTGRLVHFKGFDLVIRSFLHHVKEFPNSKLLVIGDFDEIHPSGLNESEYSLFLNNDSILKIGWVNNVQDYLSVSNVMIFPSSREGFPVCLMESHSMGLPVITINSRGCNEIVENQFNGFITEPHETLITEKMKSLVTDTMLYKMFSNNALLYRGKYDRKLFTNHQFKIYKDLI